MTQSNPDVRAVAEELRRESAEDYVGLWQIVRSLNLDVTPHDTIVEMVVQVAAHLLADGTISFGQFDSGVFQPWGGDSTTQVERLRQELRQLDRVPDIGDIGWFAAR